MTSPVIAEGWNMTGKGDWRAWREVVAAWAVATVLAAALLVTMPSHDYPVNVPSLWSLSPAAGEHVHRNASDAEGPMNQACSDRDYANERC